MKGKKLLSLFLALVMVFALCGTSLAAQDKDIVILHTNDVHGGYNQGVGYAGLAAYKDALAVDNYVTLVDAGDFSQGSTMGTLSQGEYLIELMNAVGYDIVVPGNHEFDYGMAQALKNLNALDATVVSCNFVDLSTGKPVYDAYTVVEYGDVKVAYVGICTPETYTKSTPTYFQNAAGQYIYSFCEGAGFYSTVQAAIDAAAAEADYVIAMGHCGIDEQSSPWTSKEIIANTSGIDAFIDGHSHSKIENEQVANKNGENVVLAQTGTKLGAIGKLTIASDGSISAELVSEYEGEDEAVAARIAEIESSYQAMIQEVVATSEVTLTDKHPDGSRAVRNSETNMGDLIADAYRVVMGADIGIMNGGGIRASIQAGEVTLSDILDVMTFGNMATVVEATGQQIIDCLEMGAAAFPGESGGFVHVSGMSYTIDGTIASSVVKDSRGNFESVAGERRVKDVQVDGKPIDLNKTYTVACHSYWLTSYGDGMTMFQGSKIVDEKHELYVDNYMMSLYIQENLGGVITAEQYGESQGRITIIRNPFTDVASGEWYFENVMNVYKKGIMDGTGEGIFNPTGSLTRAQIVTMLYRMEGSPAVEGSVSSVFADCEDGAYYDAAVVWASQNGIVSGVSDTSFAPNSTLSRQQMATVLYNFCVFKGDEKLTEPTLAYADAADVADWALEGVAYCTAEGIMTGVSDTAFNPNGTANRAMGARVLDLLSDAA